MRNLSTLNRAPGARRRLTVWPRTEQYDGITWVVSHGPSILAVVATLAEAERVAALVAGRAGQ